MECYVEDGLFEYANGETDMTKQEFIAHAVAMYRVANMSDSDIDPRREEWTVPAMSGGACCQHLDAMFQAMRKAGVLTSEEMQEIYDTL